MNKYFITLGFSVLFSICAHAQLRVDSLGRMSLSPNQSTTTGYAATIQALETGGLQIKRDFASGKYTNYGVNVSINTNGNFSSGIYSNAVGLSSSTFVFGTRSVGSGGHQTIGVYGGIGYAPYTGAGVVGSTISCFASPTYIQGIYAGFFYGNVKATGTIYGTLVSPSSVSSPSNGSGETTVLSTVGERSSNVINKLQQVDLLQMERINQDGSLPANKAVEDVDENEAPIQTKLSAVSYGLAADQLQKVYPELVYKDAEGNYSINYIEMVPLLVQSIKELSAKVTSLEQQLGIAEKAEVKAESEETDDIALVVPEGAKDATLSFFDLSGKQVRTARVTAVSSNAKTYTRGLPSGAYVCTLVVDGQVKSSRKIVVTNI